MTRDYSESAAWAERAAEQGYARAQTDLAYLYERGKGVPLDYVMAYISYDVAQAGGDERASARMKELAGIMTSRQVLEARARAPQFSRPAWQDHLSNPNAAGNALVSRE